MVPALALANARPPTPSPVLMGPFAAAARPTTCTTPQRMRPRCCCTMKVPSDVFPGAPRRLGQAKPSCSGSSAIHFNTIGKRKRKKEQIWKRTLIVVRRVGRVLHSVRLVIQLVACEPQVTRERLQSVMRKALLRAALQVLARNSGELACFGTAAVTYDRPSGTTRRKATSCG